MRVAVLAVASAACFAVSDAFQVPGSAMGLRAFQLPRATMARPRALRLGGVKMQEGGETPPEQQASGQETVEISREELKALAEAAGITVKTTGDIIKEERQKRRAAELEAAKGPNVFTPFIEALNPVMELPPLIQYPVILLIFGALSFPFTFLFGSGSLGGDRVATPPSEPTAVVQKEVKKPTAEDPSNSIAPKELQINRKSCDIWPYSLTPTCSDPDIGEKAILKNLDKYTNQGWKEKAGIKDAAKSAPAPAASDAEE